MTATVDAEARKQFWRDRRAGHPQFWKAVVADARITLRHRGEPGLESGLRAAYQIARLALASDAFLAHMLYRAKARLQALGIPILPRIAHRLAIVLAQVSIGDPVVMEPGVYVAHGQMVIDGLTRIEAGALLYPFITIGLLEGNLVGPTIERDVRVGTGARILGPWTIGEGATIGANAVVLSDVPAGATVVGAPARPV